MNSTPFDTNRHPRVLVMDDEEPIREIVQAMLTKFGYQPILACDGQEAVAQYAAALQSGKPFDAVLLDLNVPGGMGGEETSRKILEMDPKARIAVSSGRSDDPIMENFQAYRLKGALPKPYRINQLKEAINRLVFP